MIDKTVSIALYRSISEENQERKYLHWHASSIATCPRAHYFKRLGLEPLHKPTGAKVLRWSAGHYLERGIRPHIEKLYKGVASNERMTSKAWDLTGEYDNYAAEDEALIEIKSVSDYAFIEEAGELGLKEEAGTVMRGNREVKQFKRKTTPYLHHELQQHCYVILLAELGRKVKKIDYVYISLSGRLVVYSTEPNPLLIEAVKRRLTTLNEAWEKQVPPDCTCSPDNPLWGPVLQWCDFKTDSGCCDLHLLTTLSEKPHAAIQA